MMSKVGLAARPGTAVEPICSTAEILVPNRASNASRSASKPLGQAGSGGTISMWLRGL